MAGQSGLASAATVLAVLVVVGWVSIIVRCRLQPPPPRRDASSRSVPDDVALNTVSQGAQLYLRVVIGHSERVHVAGTVPLDSDEGRPAIKGPVESQVTGSLAAYACWTSRTLCGMPWQAMASAEDELDAVTASLARGEGGETHDCPVCAVVVIDDAWDPSARRR